MLRTTAFVVAGICATVFMAVIIWGVAIERPRLGGNRICALDAASAQLFRADGPGVYMFDRSTGLPARIPASTALGMLLEGRVDCGLMALQQAAGGLVAAASLIVAVLALLIGSLARPRATMSQPGPT